MNRVRKTSNPSSGRRIAVCEPPHLAQSPRTNGGKRPGSGLQKAPRRIADPRDAKDRRASVHHTAPSSGHQKQNGQPPTEARRRVSAPEMPTKTTQLTEEERLIIAQLRLNKANKPPESNHHHKTSNSSSDRQEKSRRVSFLDSVKVILLSPLAEEEE